ncbi:MAG: glycogen-binding domain-containing protein [Candidatus Wallbacteria bacterium]|nr:glycogen-binding domain-containing protein [Candidatus Wallbacteria bacterium]
MNRFLVMILCFPLLIFASAVSDNRGRVEFSYFCPEGACVTLHGSFNNWHEVPMKRDSEGWHRTRLYLPPGEYEYHFMVNSIFRRLDPDNPSESGGNSLLSLQFGSMMDYKDNLLTVGLFVNLQPSVQFEDFIVLEKFLRELKRLKVPVNITFNSVYLDHLKKNGELASWLSKDDRFYFYGTAGTRSFLPVLRNRKLKETEMEDWKKDFTRVFRVPPVIFAAPYLGVDEEVLELALEKGYRSVVLEKRDEYYPYTVDGLDLVIYPALSVMDKTWKLYKGDLAGECESFLRSATDKGFCYPFLALYIELGNEEDLSFIETLVERLERLKKMEFLRFAAFPEYYPEILITRPRSILKNLVRPEHYRFSSSMIDRFYTDKLAYWMKYLQYNYPGRVTNDDRGPFLDRIMENWFLREEHYFFEVMERLNREYYSLQAVKPYTGVRQFDGKHFVFLENDDMLLSFDVSTGKLVEVHMKPDGRTLFDFDPDRLCVTFLGRQTIEDFDFFERSGNRLTFFKKLDDDLDGFVLQQTYEIFRKGRRVLLTYRVTNSTEITRSMHLRYSGMGASGPASTFSDRFDDGEWQLKVSEFINKGKGYIESRSFTLKPGMRKMLLLEMTVQ